MNCCLSFREGASVPRTSDLDRTILEAALEGLERRLAETNSRISEVKRLLAGRTPAAAPAAATRAPRKKRTMSAAARKRIAEAQKRRWEQFRASRKGGKRQQGKPAAETAGE
jgi:hypothetical protein